MRQVEVGIHLQLGDLVGHVQERLGVHGGEGLWVAAGKGYGLWANYLAHSINTFGSAGEAEFLGWVIEGCFDFDVGRSIRHFLLIERKEGR